MKKIITAIGNENLNKRLKQENTLEIIGEDIQYKEGILELLEQNKNIDFLILSELIPGEIALKELIEKIKVINANIQIILFLEEKREELENYLYSKGINFIFYHNQIDSSKIIEIIKSEKEDTNKQLKEEVEELKKLLIEKEKITEMQKNNSQEWKIKNKSSKNLNSLKNIIVKKNKKETKREIICISGTSGVGKSIFSINLAKSFMEYKNKILIIDFDVLNNSLHTILGIKKYPEKIREKIKNNNLLKEIQVEELRIKVNSKIDLISGMNLILDPQYKISSIKMKNILEKLKERYEIIIIDTSSECFLDYTKEIMKNSNINIFILEATLSEIKKAKRLLNIYINNWKIPQNYFNILFNKYNENSIDISILKNIFSDFSILGKIENSPKYNLLINKNDSHSLEKNLQEEYREINKKL